MSDSALFILTHKYPVAGGEDFLNDELRVLSNHFKQIYICPFNIQKASPETYLPVNVKVLIPPPFCVPNQGFASIFRRLGIIISEFRRVPSKALFFKTFLYNYSLLKQAEAKGNWLFQQLENHNRSILYTFWFDELALIAAFCKRPKQEITFVSRAHGFDVFEEQSDVNHIFFRPFQLSLVDKLMAVSKAGAIHLKKMNPVFSEKITHRYLGTSENGSGYFENTSRIRIVSCSHIRSIKRLDLLADALAGATAEIEWHVIGDGPDAPLLKSKAGLLPDNVKVIFHGHLMSAEIHILYSSVHFDFLVSLSSSEGLPVSMMEAISHGIPVLSTDVGGCSEIVNPQTGVLISGEFDLNTLRSRIENCKSAGFNTEAGRNTIREFWEKHFNAQKNYTEFANTIQSLSTHFG